MEPKGMGDTASGDDGVLLAPMKALARRGASLKREPDGAGTIERSDKRRLERRVSKQEFLRLLDAGWVRPNGRQSYVISRRGASALRTMLNRPREGDVQRSGAVRMITPGTRVRS